MILTFGKYRGQHTKDIPTWYLKALPEKDKGMRDYVREAIREEVDQRTSAASGPKSREV